jgi:hypothetical protein
MFCIYGHLNFAITFSTCALGHDKKSKSSYQTRGKKKTTSIKMITDIINTVVMYNVGFFPEKMSD